MSERECSVCAMPIDDLEQGTAEEEAAYDAGLCMTDFEGSETEAKFEKEVANEDQA